MHTCQIMLVEAENGKEALSLVESQITYSEVPYPSWSDWHTIGGRWDGLFEGWEADQNALGYTENPALAEDIIKSWTQSRQDEIERNLREVMADGIPLDKVVAQYKVDAEDFSDWDMRFYSLRKLGELLSNKWSHDTGVYDLEAHTASLHYFRERLAKEPNKQFLVPVDFHF